MLLLSLTTNTTNTTNITNATNTTNTNKYHKYTTNILQTCYKHAINTLQINKPSRNYNIKDK
jgi:hypothetical protein